MSKIKIFIADDHCLFRTALVKLIRDFKRIGDIKEAANGKELLHLIRSDIPDVVILDLDMPVLDGAKTCEKISHEFPEVKIIILSIHGSRHYIFHLLQNGAHAFLSKNIEPTELENAIYSVADVGIYRNKIMNDAIRCAFPVAQKTVVNNTQIKLSDRESDIIKLLAKEFTNKQIGSELSLSEFTIKNHKVRIMRKTGVRNTYGLIRYAFQNGLVEL